MTARRKPAEKSATPTPDPEPTLEPAQSSARLLSRAAKIATSHKAEVDFNIAVTVHVPQVADVLDYLNGRAVAEAVAPYVAQLKESEIEMATIKADNARLRKAIDKAKAAAAKKEEERARLAADEVTEDEEAAATVAALNEQIAALQAKIDAAPAPETPEQVAEREKDQADLEGMIAEVEELGGGVEEEPAPEPAPEPTPTPEPTPPTPPDELAVEEVDPNA